MTDRFQAHVEVEITRKSAALREYAPKVKAQAEEFRKNFFVTLLMTFGPIMLAAVLFLLDWLIYSNICTVEGLCVYP